MRKLALFLSALMILEGNPAMAYAMSPAGGPVPVRAQTAWLEEYSSDEDAVTTETEGDTSSASTCFETARDESSVQTLPESAADASSASVFSETVQDKTSATTSSDSMPDALFAPILADPVPSSMPAGAVSVTMQTKKKIYSYAMDQGYGFAFSMESQDFVTTYLGSFNTGDIRIQIDNGAVYSYDSNSLRNSGIFSQSDDASLPVNGTGDNCIYVPVGFLDKAIPAGSHTITAAISRTKNKTTTWYQGQMTAEFINDDDLSTQRYDPHIPDDSNFFSAKKGGRIGGLELFADACSADDEVISRALVKHTTGEIIQTKAMSVIPEKRYNYPDARYVNDYLDETGNTDGNGYEQYYPNYTLTQYFPEALTYYWESENFSIDFELDHDIDEGWYDVTYTTKKNNIITYEKAYYATREPRVCMIDSIRYPGGAPVKIPSRTSDYIALLIYGINFSDDAYPYFYHMVNGEPEIVTTCEPGNMEIKNSERLDRDETVDPIYYEYIFRLKKTDVDIWKTSLDEPIMLKVGLGSRLFDEEVTITYGKFYASFDYTVDGHLFHDSYITKEYYDKATKLGLEVYGDSDGDRYKTDLIQDITLQTTSISGGDVHGIAECDVSGFEYPYGKPYGIVDNGKDYDLFSQRLWESMTGEIIDASTAGIPVSDRQGAMFEIRELSSMKAVARGNCYYKETDGRDAGTESSVPTYAEALTADELEKLHGAGVFRLITFNRDGIPVCQNYIGHFPAPKEPDPQVADGTMATLPKLYAYAGDRGYGFAFSMALSETLNYNLTRQFDLTDIRIGIDGGDEEVYDGSGAGNILVSPQNKKIYFPVGFLDKNITPGIHTITISLSRTTDGVKNWYTDTVTAEFVREDLRNQRYEMEEPIAFSGKPGEVIGDTPLGNALSVEDEIIGATLVAHDTGAVAETAVTECEISEYSTDMRYTRYYLGAEYEKLDHSLIMTFPRTWTHCGEVRFALGAAYDEGRIYDVVYLTKLGTRIVKENAYKATSRPVTILYGEGSDQRGGIVVPKRSSDYVAVWVYGINLHEDVYPLYFRDQNGFPVISDYEQGNLEKSYEGRATSRVWQYRLKKRDDALWRDTARVIRPAICMNTEYADLTRPGEDLTSYYDEIVDRDAYGIFENKKTEGTQVTGDYVYYFTASWLKNVTEVGVRTYGNAVDKSAHVNELTDRRFAVHVVDDEGNGFVRMHLTYDTQNGGGFCLYRVINGAADFTNEGIDTLWPSPFLDARKDAIPEGNPGERFEIRELSSMAAVAEGTLGMKELDGVTVNPTYLQALPESALRKLADGGIYRVVTFDTDGMPMYRAYVGNFPTEEELDQTVTWTVSYYADGVLLGTEAVEDRLTASEIPDAAGNGRFFAGWKNRATGRLWDPTMPVLADLILDAVYRSEGGVEKETEPDGRDVQPEFSGQNIYMVKGQTAILPINLTGPVQPVLRSDNPRLVRVTGKNTIKAKLATGKSTVAVRELNSGSVWQVTVVSPYLTALVPGAVVAETVRKPLSVTPGESITLSLEGFDGLDAHYGISWASSNEEVARVDSGLVYALAKGTVRITARSGGIRYTAEVRVKDTRPVGKGADNITLKPLQTVNLKFTDGFKARKAVWTSEDEELLRIYNNNATIRYYQNSVIRLTQAGRLIAVGAGTTTLTGIAGGVTKTLTITVEKPVANVITINRGKIRTLRYFGVRNEAARALWTSEDPALAAFVKKGKLKGVAPGRTVVTCQYDPYSLKGLRSDIRCDTGFTYTTVVYVEDAALVPDGRLTVKRPGISYQLAPLPVGTDYRLRSTGTSKRLVFESSRPAVAFVDEENVIRTRSRGRTVLSASVGTRKITVIVTVE